MGAKADASLAFHHDADGLVGPRIDGKVIHVLLTAHHPGKGGIHEHVPAVVDVPEGEARRVSLAGDGREGTEQELIELHP